MGTVVGSWRLKIIIVLFIFIVSTYGFYVLLGDIETFNSPIANDSYFDSSTGDVTWNSSEGEQMGTDFKDVIFGLGNFLSFGNIDNEWARLFLVNTISICLITIGYLIFTFIKEFIPLV